MRMYLLWKKRYEFSWWEDNKETTVIIWEALDCNFGTSGKNYKVAQILECRLMKKRKAI